MMKKKASDAETLKAMRARAAARQAKWKTSAEAQGLARKTLVIAACDFEAFKKLAAASCDAQIIRNDKGGVK